MLVKHGCELSRRRRRGHIAFGIGKKSKKKKKTSAAASRLPSHSHEHVGVPNLDDRDKGLGNLGAKVVESLSYVVTCV